MAQPIIQNIDRNHLNSEQKHTLDILENLSVVQPNRFKELMKQRS